MAVTRADDDVLDQLLLPCTCTHIQVKLTRPAARASEVTTKNMTIITRMLVYMSPWPGLGYILERS